LVSNDGFATRFGPAPTAATVIGRDAVLTPPASSVTTTVRVHAPAPLTWVATGSACGPTTVPSPKANRYDTIVPSGSLEPEAFAVTVRGSFPVEGVAVRTTTGSWFEPPTAIEVVADPLSALAAVKVTPNVPATPAAGVHTSVPDVLPAPAVNTASWPGGRLERSAVSDAIGFPSASAAVTGTVIACPAASPTKAGAVTAGARSTLLTVITVLATPWSALAAVNCTV
jgi:hypothetical protein